MQVAIIGAGAVGSAIARAAASCGHDVVVSAGDAARAETLAGEIGGRAAGSNAEAATDAGLVVLAVPAGAVSAVADEIRDVLSGSVVLDATNPLADDMSGLTTSGRSAAEELQDLLPASAVVKAFNTVFAGNQDLGAVDGETLDGFYAGDDAQAKAKVAEFLTGVGFRAVDAGNLTAARALEHMAFLNISLNARNDWSWRSGWRLVGPLS